MSSPAEAIREQLMASSPEFQRLREEHARLSVQLELGTSLPISGCSAPSRRGNAALRTPASADAPEQPVLDVRNQPDSHRPRRTERRFAFVLGSL